MTEDNSSTGREAIKTAGNVADAVGQTAGAIKWFAILATVVIVGGGLYWVGSTVLNIGAVVVDAAGDVVEGGVEGATAAIEATGETAAELTEAAGEAVGTAAEAFDADAAAETVDSATGWLADRWNSATDALSGDEAETAPVADEAE